MSNEIHGIPHNLKDPLVLEILDVVFGQLSCHKRDYNRVKKKLIQIKAVTKKVSNQGVGGGWLIATEKPVSFFDRFKLKGILYLPDDSDSYEDFELLGIIAHEVGHVATQLADVQSRISFNLLNMITAIMGQKFPESPEDLIAGRCTKQQSVVFELEKEWAMELAADYYANKWGFGTQLVHARVGGDPSKIGNNKVRLDGGLHPLPKSLLLLETDEVSYKLALVIDDKFKIKKVKKMPKLDSYDFVMRVDFVTLLEMWTLQKNKTASLCSNRDINFIKNHNVSFN